jgi:hypothetical protein
VRTFFFQSKRRLTSSGWVKLTNSNDTVSKGQLVFLVRRVNSAEEQSDLLARHHIFADPTAVATTIHKSLSVPLEHTLPLLKDITLWCDSTAHTPSTQHFVYRYRCRSSYPIRRTSDLARTSQQGSITYARTLFVQSCPWTG